MPKTASTQSPDAAVALPARRRRSPPRTFLTTPEIARTLLARVAPMRQCAEQLQADIETLREALPEHDRGTADSWDHAHSLRLALDSCLTYMEGVLSFLTTERGNYDCTLYQLEQIAGAEVAAATEASTGPSEAVPPDYSMPPALGAYLSEQRARASELQSLLTLICQHLAHGQAETPIGAISIAEQLAIDLTDALDPVELARAQAEAAASEAV